jgi:hypothetical protein
VLVYPHPWGLNADGSIDLSDAPQHIGGWDKVTINYGVVNLQRRKRRQPSRNPRQTWSQDLRYATNQDTDSGQESINGQAVLVKPTSCIG